MKMIDFSRSFLTFRIDRLKREATTVTHEPPYALNNARIHIECCLLVTDKHSRRSEEYVLGASCKTERVGAASDLWLQPNADFAPIFARQFTILKTYDRAGQVMAHYPPSQGMQCDRQSGLIADSFDDLRIDLNLREAEVLPTTESIVESIFKNEPLIGHTVWTTDRYHVELQYPIKTVNANERDGIYQTDTGPVIFPDLSRDLDSMIEGMDLAYSAFNCSDWIEFIVRVPTLVAEGVQVYHYSRCERLSCTNQIWRTVSPREIPRPKIAEEFADASA